MELTIVESASSNIGVKAPDSLVHLVVPPYAPPEHPALGVSVLKAALSRDGISTSVGYLNLRHAQAIGLPRNLYVGIFAPLLLGEWTFARAAFPDASRDDEGYFELALALLRSRWSHIGAHEAIYMLLEDNDLARVASQIRDNADKLIDTAATEIVSRGPRIVGCSSVFQQHCASLALLRRVRELDPDIITVIGGSNCEGPMGRANIECFPWLDFVVSGEADFSFPKLCQTVLEHGRNLNAQQVPVGVYARSQVQGLRAPVVRGLVNDLDATPVPDLSDYFDQLHQLDIAHYIEPSLLIETSRGCWWGARSHCTFCGLNGTGMGFRSKSPGRVIAEFDTLAEQYSMRRFAAVDNILDMKFFDSVLPQFSQRADPYVIFYETKANLSREQLRALRAAGVHAIQPGIESLHDDPLQRMAKGNRVATNIQLLKWAREFGIYVTWFVLSGLPDDEDHWYAEMADLVPLLSHLCPPRGVGDIEWHRFSPYYERAGEFGLVLEPSRLSRYIYPVTAKQLAELSYSFETVGKELRPRPDPERPGRERLDEAIRVWQREWEHDGARLEMTLTDDGLRIEDTRRCATRGVHQLDGLEAAVYRSCDSAQARNGLLRKVQLEMDEPVEWQAHVLPVLDQLMERNLLIRTGEKFLALAHNRPHLPTGSWSGHGAVDLTAYFADHQADTPITKLFHA